MSASRMPPAPAGGVRLTLPPGYQGCWLSNPGDRASIERWASASPEASVYNTPAYIDFARAQNGRADLLWLVRESTPVIGFPVHPVGDSRISTGYSGVMFSDGQGDGTLRRGVTALVALLGANSRLGFQVLQAAQAPAYDDPARITTLAWLFAQHRLAGPPLYSRILDLEPPASEGPIAPDVSNELLLEQGLDRYDPATRNKVRQAIRNGLHVTCALPSADADLDAVYREFLPLHRESWERTGMTPHLLDYWTALARTILDGGGRDMIVFARDADGAPLAAVNCHFRGARAVYWAGASSDQGQNLRANPLCLHAAIQACRQLGVRHFELGRFNAHERSEKELAITAYKAQFGGDLVRVGGFQIEPPFLPLVARRARSMLRRH